MAGDGDGFVGCAEIDPRAAGMPASACFSSPRVSRPLWTRIGHQLLRRHANFERILLHVALEIEAG